MAAAPAFGTDILIYNNLPSPLPASLVSQSFQAGRISEFGDLVSFDGGARDLTSATVAMVTWGYFSKYNAPTDTNTGGWTEPAITLNLYNVDNSGSSPEPGARNPARVCHRVRLHPLEARANAQLRRNPLAGC